MYPGGHGQPPGPPATGPGPVGPPGSGGDSWNPMNQGIGSGGSGLAIGALGQTMLPGPGPLGQLGMSTLGTIINNPGRVERVIKWLFCLYLIIINAALKALS